MKSNEMKLIVSTRDTTEIQVGDSVIKNSTCEKLLGVRLDTKLNFNEHVKLLCKKATSKLKALAKETPFMNLEKKYV